MGQQAAKEFERKLDDLFHYRTHWLRSAVTKISAGRPPKLTKAKIDRNITALQALATDCLIKDVSKEHFKELIYTTRRWHLKNKGWGRDEKKQSFDAWFEKYIPFKNYIYVFWANKKCIYIGRSGKGRKRVQGHFDKYWFTGVTRINIYSTPRKTDVPKFECIAKHLFEPTQNKIKPGTGNYDKKCPICSVHKFIKSELKKIFRLK